MSPHHEMRLSDKLDEIHLWGQTFFYWRDLYLWYGVQKIAARTYRNIDKRWADYSNEHELEKTELNVIVVSDSGAVFRRDLYAKERSNQFKLKNLG